MHPVPHATLLARLTSRPHCCPSPPPHLPVAALVVSFFFLVSLFFSPIIASIPPYATGPALVLVSPLAGQAGGHTLVAFFLNRLPGRHHPTPD